MSEVNGLEPTGLAIDCPSCGSAIEPAARQTEIECTVCNGRFVLAGHLCPSCATYHEDEPGVCSNCGTPLVRLCRQCQGTNWTGDEICIHCGERIDLLSQVESQSNQSTLDRLSKRMADAKALKETEAAASDRRMAELMAIEEARQADLHRQNARRKRQERNMLIVVFAAVLLFLLVLVAFALLNAAG